MNKILCAIDFSPASINALEHAAEIAEVCSATLTIVHVFTEKDFNVLYEEDEDNVNRNFDEKVALAEKRLERLTHEIKDANHRHITDVSYKLLFGDFFKQIDELNGNSYELIVMGSRGMSRRRGLILGSNTLELISKSDTNVLAVPGEASYEHYKYILYASDLHESDKVGLMKVIPLASYYDARIQVVHFTSKKLEKAKDNFNRFVDQLKSFIDYSKLGFEIYHYEDQLNMAMEEYTSEKKAQLVALLDKKHNFFESIFHESLIDKMTYITDTPLLVVKS